MITTIDLDVLLKTTLSLPVNSNEAVEALYTDLKLLTLETNFHIFFEVLKCFFYSD